MTDDPLMDFYHHDREQAKRLEERPVCDNCDNPIQHDHCYEINGGTICPHCLETYFRKELDI